MLASCILYYLSPVLSHDYDRCVHSKIISIASHWATRNKHKQLKEINLNDKSAFNRNIGHQVCAGHCNGFFTFIFSTILTEHYKRKKTQEVKQLWHASLGTLPTSPKSMYLSKGDTRGAPWDLLHVQSNWQEDVHIS